MHQITPYPHLHEGIIALGWEGLTTNPWPTSLSGEKHDGTPAANGATGFIHGGGDLYGHGAIQLDRGELILADGTHSMRPLSKLQLQPK